MAAAISGEGASVMMVMSSSPSCPSGSSEGRSPLRAGMFSPRASTFGAGSVRAAFTGLTGLTGLTVLTGSALAGAGFAAAGVAGAAFAGAAFAGAALAAREEGRGMRRASIRRCRAARSSTKRR